MECGEEEVEDEELQIMDSDSLCPFRVNLGKLETAQKWFVKGANTYHNHQLRKQVRASAFQETQSDLAGDYNFRRDFGKTKKVHNFHLS